ncbi:MAG TPA: hypothetical protein VJY62_19355 [Bacteroidia bacterium]|nr:hypothetical protein [Bacteroidia bacterium]
MYLTDIYFEDRLTHPANHIKRYQKLSDKKCSFQAPELGTRRYLLQAKFKTREFNIEEVKSAGVDEKYKTYSREDLTVTSLYFFEILNEQ